MCSLWPVVPGPIGLLTCRQASRSHSLCLRQQWDVLQASEAMVFACPILPRLFAVDPRSLTSVRFVTAGIALLGFSVLNAAFAAFALRSPPPPAAASAAPARGTPRGKFPCRWLSIRSALRSAALDDAYEQAIMLTLLIFSWHHFR